MNKNKKLLNLSLILFIGGIVIFFAVLLIRDQYGLTLSFREEPMWMIISLLSFLMMIASLPVLIYSGYAGEEVSFKKYLKEKKTYKSKEGKRIMKDHTEEIIKSIGKLDMMLLYNYVALSLDINDLEGLLEDIDENDQYKDKEIYVSLHALDIEDHDQAIVILNRYLSDKFIFKKKDGLALIKSYIYSNMRMMIGYQKDPAKASMMARKAYEIFKDDMIKGFDINQFPYSEKPKKLIRDILKYLKPYQKDFYMDMNKY